jgi:CHAT domain-containing protein
MGLVPFQDVVWTYAVWAGGTLINQRPLPVPDAQQAATGVPDSDHRSLRPRQDTQPTAIGPWDQTYLAELAKATLDPLEERFAELEPDDRLIISASGGLHRVPFSVLPYHGTPLCEQISICLVQGLGVLEAGLAEPIRDVRSALCLGGPAHPGLTRLRGALAEAQEIAALFTRLDRESSLLVGPDATVPALRAHAAQSDVVHVACHALAAESSDGLSSLMLTPCPQPVDNGILTDDRIISEILLSPGALVNLAGCMTGAQTESSSPLLGGLIPAFLIAGASSVVASLWPIHDLKAPKFQTRFYEHMLGGSSPATSLAMTQRECIDGALGADMQDPSVWGGYVIYGVG